jgi:hypothetical protein
MVDTDEEHYVFVKRYMQFHNLWTVYSDLLSGRYVPSLSTKTSREVPEADWETTTDMRATLMFLLYSFFYSLIEDSDDGLNAFRIWRAKYPDEERAITALERLILPFRPDLKVFRNRMGFHGSRSQQREVKGLDIFGNFSGDQILGRMAQFKALNAALLEKNLARQSNSVERLKDARSRIDLITERCEAMGG